MAEKKIPTKMYIDESELPRYWYNINAVMKDKHEPALDPKTLKPCTLEDYKEVYAVMDAIYRKETYGYTHGASNPRVNANQKRKSTRYLGFLGWF